MAKVKGRDSEHRQKRVKRGPGGRIREVYVFAEGEATEDDYIELVKDHGTRADAAHVISVDYVIAHELAHIKVAGHGPDYWRLLRRAIPECELLKAELDEMGRRVWLGDLAAPESAGRPR